MNALRFKSKFNNIRRCSTKAQVEPCTKNCKRYAYTVLGCTFIGTVYGFCQGVAETNIKEPIDMKICDVIGSTICGTLVGCLFGLVSPVVVPVGLPAFLAIQMKEAYELRTSKK